MCMLIKTIKMAKRKKTVDQPNINVDEARQSEYIARLQRMLQCRTVSDNNVDETEFEKFRTVLREEFPLIHEKAECMSFDGCLVFKIKGASDRNIILMSHHDVVEDKGEWAHPAFGAEIHDGKIFARGTLDTKTPLFAELQAVEELLAEGFEFPVNVYIASSNNEEVCGEGIVKAVNYWKGQGIHFEMVLDEGGAIMEKMVPGVAEHTAMVAVHEKSRHTFTCVAKKCDPKGHSGFAGKADSPISRMAAFIDEAEHMKFKTRLYPEVRAMFEHCAPNMTFPMRYLFSNLGVFGPLLVKLLPSISAETTAMLGTSLMFTSVESVGGSKQVRPDEVRVNAFMRCVRDSDLREEVERLKAIGAKHGVEITPDIVDYCHPADFEGKPFEFVENVIHENFPNTVVAPFLLTAGTDARRLTDVADNIYRFAPIFMTREQFATVHSPNENINCECVGEAVCFYKNVVKKYK